MMRRAGRQASRALSRGLARARSVRRRTWAALALGALLGPWLVLFVWAALTPLPPELAGAPPRGSVRFTDREGRLLREVRADDGSLSRWVGREEWGKWVEPAVIAAEDGRFRAHFGVDPIAVARATWDDATSLRVVSGASTLDMQLARNVRPHPRTLWGKLGEMALAIRIDRDLGKDRVLEEYVNRVAFGPSLRGMEAASIAYFGRPTRELSLAQTALLAGIPRGPSVYDPRKHAALAKVRRDRVLGRMLAAGLVGREEHDLAVHEPVSIRDAGPVFGAPHLVQALVAGSLERWSPGSGERVRGQVEVRTTIDRELQGAAEAAVRRTLDGLQDRRVGSAAALVIDNASGEVLAYVGSGDFHGPDGQNDAARALRQPGSTLKPFVYGLAMERLGWSPATVLFDTELHLPVPGGDYSPHDYDRRFRGPVRLREALGNSLNVPAVRAADAVGVDALLSRLRDVGFDSLTRPAAEYGPALALGDGEVTLLDLARAYATLARGGSLPLLRFERGAPSGERSVLPAATCALLTDVLRDPRARLEAFGTGHALDFPFDVAAKTGTSKGYRDNWVVGYTRAVTVAVWVGNMDGSPMSGTSGITGAGPIFHAVMLRAMEGRPPISLAATGADGLQRVRVCALSGHRAGRDCPHALDEWMEPAAEGTLGECAWHARVRVDARNGLLAGPACAAGDTREVVVEALPPELAAWAAATGRTLRPTEASPSCPLAEAPSGPLAITHPMDGARFVLDPDVPRSAQRLEVHVVSASPEVELLADGSPIARARAPFDFSWPLAEGTHVLQARAGGQASAPVRVTVRAP